MKLAFCLFRYYPFGGLERDFMRIAIAAQKRGHSITVYTMSWEGEIPEGFVVNIVTAKGLWNHARCLSYIKNLAVYLQEQAFDLVIGFNRMPGLDVYYAADICHIANSNKYGNWYRFLPRNLAYYGLEHAVFAPQAKTKIFLLSAAEQLIYQKHYGTPNDRFYLLPPGIDKTRILHQEKSTLRQQLCHEFNLKEEHHLLLMVGSDFRRKGVDRAIKGLAALPPALRSKTFLMIIGNGKAKTLLTLAAFLGVQKQVLFLGPRHDIGRFMLGADALVHPAYSEAAGMVLLEALVSELPVLVTENCGYAFHITQADVGIVVPSFQQKIFNASLVEILTSPKRKIWQENAKKYALESDLYSLPERAVELLDQFHRDKSSSNFKEIVAPHHTILDRTLQKHWQNINIFQHVFTMPGIIYRHEKNRKTLRFLVEDKSYFIKLHHGVGWKEIFKNLLQGRWPVLGAQREWRAIQRLKQMDIPTMNLAAYGKRGWNPAKLQSFVVTDELIDTISLEDYCRDWVVNPPSLKFKRRLISKVAKIANSIHSQGINHRDFYLCHFLLDKKSSPLKLFLIDLHRMQIRHKTPKRWLVRDIAGLYFSSMDVGLSQRDFFWFIKKYTSKSLAEVFRKEGKLWYRVEKRARKLYMKINKNKEKVA